MKHPVQEMKATLEKGVQEKLIQIKKNESALIKAKALDVQEAIETVIKDKGLELELKNSSSGLHETD